MKPGRLSGGISIAVITLVAVVTHGYMRADERKAQGRRSVTAKTGRTPILVELFTSEGCSSCPSADKLLAKLATTQPVEGAEIIALEEHVDYWNRIGWTDPFSAAKFTQRQYDYGSHFHLNSVYTPQAVVDGQQEFVGSDTDSALSAISRAAAQPKVGVGLRVTAENAMQLHLNVSVEKRAGRNEAATVVLAVAEDDLAVHVKSGENAGRNLVHHGVVRWFRTLGNVQDNAAFTTQVTVPLERGWRRENLRLVAFVQSETSRRIEGVGTLPLAELPKG
jgi:hypothetical protein